MNKKFDFLTQVPAGIAKSEDRPYLHTVEAGAKLPLIQSAIWGLAAGLLALIAILSLGIPMWPDDLLWPAWAAIVGFALAWRNYQRHWFRLSSLERLTGVDLNGDGKVGSEVRSEPQVVSVQINEVDKDGHFHVRRQFDLPASREQMEQLAYGLLRMNRPFTFREWTGKGKPFSDNEFETLRSEMIKRGLVANNGADARRGLTLTEAGRAVLEKLLEE